MTGPARLRIAIQKSGRLAEPSLDLLDKCGIKFTKSKDQLFCSSKNFSADLLMLRDDDIPELVQEGACDLGIVGLNVLEEQEYAFAARGRPLKLKKLSDLGFGFCRLSLAAPRDSGITDPKQLDGKKIATSYPGITENWLKSQDINATTVILSGAIEVAPRLAIADAICDLVSTGGTLAANGLKELAPVFESQSVLIRRNEKLDPQKEMLITRLMNRIAGVQKADDSKYIMLHSPIDALERVKAAIPGVESPTIVPLQGITDKVAVHAVCRESVFWETMEDLKAAGASAILVMPIEKILD